MYGFAAIQETVLLGICIISELILKSVPMHQ